MVFFLISVHSEERGGNEIKREKKRKRDSQVFIQIISMVIVLNALF